MPDFDDIDITADLGQPGQVDASNAEPQSGVIPHDAEPTHKQASDVVQVNERPVNEKPHETSIRDQLSSAFSEEKPAEAQTEQKPALSQDEAGKWRRADGTFATAEEVAAQTATQENTQQTEQKPYAGMLSRFTEAETRQFQALPPELQEWLGRTTEVVEGQAARYNEYNLLESELIGPRREAWQANGLTPAVAIQQLFALSDFATRSPTEFALWFADQNGIDLDAALDARDAQLQQVDPQVAQLQQELAQLRGTVSGFEQQQQSVVQQRNMNDVQTFAEEKDAGGNFKRPYLTEVLQDFSAQIAAIRVQSPNMPNAEVLQKAYDNACWSNPTVRGKMQAASEAARAQQQQEEANRAKVASSSISGGPSGTVIPKAPENSNRSIRDELAAQFANAS